MHVNIGNGICMTRMNRNAPFKRNRNRRLFGEGVQACDYMATNPVVLRVQINPRRNSSPFRLMCVCQQCRIIMNAFRRLNLVYVSSLCRPTYSLCWFEMYTRFAKCAAFEYDECTLKILCNYTDLWRLTKTIIIIIIPQNGVKASYLYDCRAMFA